MVHKLMAVLYEPLLLKGGEHGPCKNTPWFILVLNCIRLITLFCLTLSIILSDTRLHKLRACINNVTVCDCREYALARNSDSHEAINYLRMISEPDRLSPFKSRKVPVLKLLFILNIL